MNIHTNHPSFDSFIRNEVDTLTYLTTRDCTKDYTELTTDISRAYAEYTSKLKTGKLNHFNFHSKFIMEVERFPRYVLIGANVTADFSECSYFLAMTDAKEENKLIRKFHFDYAIKNNRTNQDVPSFHLQYGGKMSPRMHEDGLDDTKLDHWLSLPRLNFYPVNLALLMDLMLCEFHTMDTKKIIESSEWRTLIYKNEVFLSANYFKAISEYLNSQEYKQTRLIRDFCYGK